MSFSASTCLTNSGTISLGNLFNIYSNVGGYITPFQTNITYSQLFNNCPYIMGNVPDGTTSIKIINTVTKCCSTIELLSNDLCTTCDLAFDEYETSNIGVIVAGELTGSCDTNITDYRIYWYGPNSSTNIAFTSGYGSEFSPYDLTHPLVGINSPTALAGTYIPVVDKVKLNGLNYSQTGDTGYIQAELKCFNATTVQVLPYTCNNGTETSGNYTHRVNFSATASGIAPLTLQSTFNLDLSTDYFAWKFKGESIPDSLKITFYGSAYSNNPIILEYWTVGLNTSTNINLTTFPKSGKTNSYLSKVTSLTSLTRNVGDYLILEVIPNQFNTQTNWDFYFTCLETFNCDLCLFDYLNTPYKIDASSITGITGSCSTISVYFDVSGCTTNSVFNSDIFEYMTTNLQGMRTTEFYSVFSDTGLLSRNTQVLDWGNSGCTISNYVFYNPPVCATPPNTNTISFSKSNTGPLGQGVINMTFSSLSDFTAYKTSYDSILQYSGTPSNPSNLNYYRSFSLLIPLNSGSEKCGDGTQTGYYTFHYNSVVTTGNTAGNYTLQITMPTISDGLPPFNPCDVNCQTYVDIMIDNINNSSTGATNVTSFTSNTGSKYVNPFGVVSGVTPIIPTATSAATLDGQYYLSNYLNSTVPFSGSSSPYTQLPSLSALTCNNFTSIGESSASYQYIFAYYYKIELTDISNVKSFRILATPIVNGVPSGIFSDVVATVVNGVTTYTNPLYTF